MSDTLFKEEVAETAMCIWEWVLEHDPTPQLDAWKESIGGTCALRSHCLTLAQIIEDRCLDIYAEAEHAMWNQAFDWDVIPWIMSHYIMVICEDDYQEDPKTLRNLTLQAWQLDHK